MTHKYNSENVFEVIGDHPVVDQYDILYSNLLSGSMHDDYVTGSLFHYIGPSVATIVVTGSRGRVFSKLGVNSKDLPLPISNDSTSYSLQPWRERAGIIRNIRIFSSDERFYDSMQPVFSDLFDKIEGKISEDSVNKAVISLGNIDSPTFNFSNSEFRPSFPFEPKYANVDRTKRQLSYKANVDSSGNNLSEENLCKNLFIYNDNITQAYWSDTPLGLNLTEIDSSKILFGFGDRNERYLKVSIFPPSFDYWGEKYLPDFRLYATPYFFPYIISPIIRGWKYGLIDGNPHYTSAVYRRNRFGQVRDMLEQRLVAYTVKDPGNSFYNYKDNFGASETSAVQKGKSEELEDLSGDYSVLVRFIKQKVINNKLVNISVSPDSTWSSNLSIYATSSLPYFDGMSKNRTKTPTITNIQDVTLTLKPDIFGNITLTPL